ncbi:hypothetical protein [uncultured Treponema sp.]
MYCHHQNLYYRTRFHHLLTNQNQAILDYDL